MKKLLIITTLFPLIFGCKIEINKEKEKKPNIIVILVDDAGYFDFGFTGSKDLETPNLDKLAANGVILSDAHVTATVCAPSRAGLITGKYQQRYGFEANHTGDEKSGDIGLDENVKTIADVFQKNNYKTIALGKWHLGASEDDHPNQRGFDEFYGFLAGGRSYFPLENPSKFNMLQQNGKRIIFDGYMTDVLGDRAASFIEENKDNPFFMYAAFNAVHTPMHAKKEYLEKYKNHPRKELAAMTRSLDENVGKIVSKLKNVGQLENTLIFFLSDNGGAIYNQSKNGKLKGFKGNKFEAGHRIPFLVHWKGKLKGNNIFNGLSSSLDIFPTALAASGINEDLDLDGVNLLPYLTGQKQGNPHKKLFWRKLGVAAARIGDYKLIRLNGYGSVLYNLKNDLSELENLSNSDKTNLNLLSDELESWETKLMKPLWGEGEWAKTNFHIHQRLMENKPILYRTPEENKK